MSLDMTTFDAALKAHYTDVRIATMTYKDNPLYAMLPKVENFGGRNLPIPIIYGIPQGRSTSFAKAQTNVDESQITDFVLTRVSDHGVAVIANEVIEASKNANDAFMQATTTEIDGILMALKRSMATALYRNGGGSIGRLKSDSGVTTVITLSEPEDVTNFEIGMVLNLSTADGTSGAIKVGTTKISKIDRGAGTLTVLTNMNTFSAAGAVNDYIFVEGDFGGKLTGLDGWVPSSAPSATSFFGVDRSVDTTRLSGVRSDGSGKPIEEALIDGLMTVSREGGSPDKCFMNYKQWANLEKALGSKVQYVDLVVDGLVGFRGIQINGPKGTIDIIADQNCPNGVAYLLQMDTWKWYGLGKAPRIFDDDGNKVLRQAAADGIEVRALYRGQLGCTAPGWNARVALA